jgi:ribonuclease HI
MNPEVEIWTDGSTYPANPGRGGWGAVIIGTAGKKQKIRVLSGVDEDSGDESTNNRTETLAVLMALNALTAKTVHVQLYTDSASYVISGLKRLRYNRMPETHIDLWASIKTVIHYKNIKLDYEHTRGHSVSVMNEWADELAKGASKDGIVLDEVRDSPPRHLVTRVQRRLEHVHGDVVS